MKRFLKWFLAIVVGLVVVGGGALYAETNLYEGCLAAAQKRGDVSDCDAFLRYFSWRNGAGGAHYHRGLVYKAAGEADKAIEDFRAAVRINEPGSSLAHEQLTELGAAP